MSSSVNLGISVSFLTVNYTVDPSGSLQARARQGQIFFHLSDKKTWKDIRELTESWKVIRENMFFFSEMAEFENVHKQNCNKI